MTSARQFPTWLMPSDLIEELLQVREGKVKAILANFKRAKGELTSSDYLIELRTNGEQLLRYLG